MSDGGNGSGAAQAVAPDLSIVKIEMDAEEYDMPQQEQEQAPPSDLSSVKIEIQIEPTEVLEQVWDEPESSGGAEVADASADTNPRDPDPLLDAEPMWEVPIKYEPTYTDGEPTAAQGAPNLPGKPKKIRMKKFICALCEYRTAICSHFKRHIKTHTGEKPFNCDQCEYRTAEKINLKQHMRTHTGERPYPCEHCDHRFAQRNDLKKHIRIHTGEKPFKCNQCDYRAAQSGKIKQHMTIHTGEKPFKCNQCEYSCARSGHLKRHLRTHTGDMHWMAISTSTEMLN